MWPIRQSAAGRPRKHPTEYREVGREVVVVDALAAAVDREPVRVSVARVEVIAAQRPAALAARAVDAEPVARVAHQPRVGVAARPPEAARAGWIAVEAGCVRATAAGVGHLARAGVKPAGGEGRQGSASHPWRFRPAGRPRGTDGSVEASRSAGQVASIACWASAVAEPANGVASSPAAGGNWPVVVPTGLPLPANFVSAPCGPIENSAPGHATRPSMVGRSARSQVLP